MDLDHAGSRSGALAQGRKGLRLFDLERTLLGTVPWVPPRGCGSGLLRSCAARPRRNLRGVGLRSRRPSGVSFGGRASEALHQGALGASRQHYLHSRALGGQAPGPHPAAESPSGRERTRTPPTHSLYTGEGQRTKHPRVSSAWSSNAGS